VFELARPCAVVIPVSADHLRLHGGEEDLHITLLMVEDVNIAELTRICTELARECDPFEVKTEGLSSFSVGDDTETIHMTVSSPELTVMRKYLEDEVVAAGMTFSKKHPFSPHITMAYVPKGTPAPVLKVNPDINVDSIELWNNGVRFPYSF